MPLAGAWDLPLARDHAALLWAPQATLALESAGAIHLITSSPGAVHLAVPRHRGHTTGVITHEFDLRPNDLTEHQGLTLTTPIRTITDLAAIYGEARLERALGEAQIHRLVTDRQLREAAQQSRPGMPRLRAILDDVDGFTRNAAERELRDLLRRGGLPQPRLNARIAGHEVDVYWPQQRLVLEFQGYGPHRTRRKFERDARKAADLAAAGIRVSYATWRHLRREPLALLARTAMALSR